MNGDVGGREFWNCGGRKWRDGGGMDGDREKGGGVRGMGFSHSHFLPVPICEFCHGLMAGGSSAPDGCNDAATGPRSVGAPGSTAGRPTTAGGGVIDGRKRTWAMS